MTVFPDPTRFLRRVLQANAASCIGFGLIYAACPEAVAHYFGDVGTQDVLQEAIFLLVFAGWLIHVSFREVLPLWQVLLIVLLDFVGVAGYAARILAVPGTMTYTGRITMIVIGDIVAAFAILQIVGLRRARLPVASEVTS